MPELDAAFRRVLSRLEKARPLYLLVGGLATLVVQGGALLPELGLRIPVPERGNVLCTVYVYFPSHTLLRYCLFDPNELLGRITVLAACTIACQWGRIR